MRVALHLAPACAVMVMLTTIVAMGAGAWPSLRTALTGQTANNNRVEKRPPNPTPSPVPRSPVVQAQVWHEELTTQRFWRDNNATRVERPDVLPWDRPADDDRWQRPTQRGTYRTVCVRLCDGYYWPISFATTSAHFQIDRRKCEQSCGSPVELYKYPNPGGQPEEMEDLRGQAYTQLKTAFLYRSAHNASCKCKADPWEEAAKQQHLDYARAAKKSVTEARASGTTQLPSSARARKPNVGTARGERDGKERAHAIAGRARVDEE